MASQQSHSPSRCVNHSASFNLQTLPDFRTEVSQEFLLDIEQKIKGVSSRYLMHMARGSLNYTTLQRKPAIQRAQALIFLDMCLTLRPDDLDPSFVADILTQILHAIETWDFYGQPILLLGDYHCLLVSTFRTCSSPQLLPILKSVLRNLHVQAFSDHRYQLATFLLLSVWGARDKGDGHHRLHSVLFCHWDHIKYKIVEIMSKKDRLKRPTVIFAILVFIHNWVHEPRLYQFLKENGEFGFSISILIQGLKCNVGELVVTSVSILRNIASCLRRDVIPFASKIIQPVLEAMKQQHHDPIVLLSGFVLFTVIAKYSGSAFLNHVPMIMPNVFSTLMDSSTKEDIYCVARSLLLETFLAVGRVGFKPYFKKSTESLLNTRHAADNIGDTLLFLCFFNEYDGSTISEFYPKSEVESLLSRAIPLISEAIDGLSFSQRENSRLDLFLGILPKLVEFATVYLPEFDQLRDNLFVMMEGLLAQKVIVVVDNSRVTGVPIDTVCIALLVFYILEMMKYHKAGENTIDTKNERTRRTRKLVSLILDARLMTAVIVEKITLSLATLLQYDGSKKFPEHAMNEALINLRGVLVSGQDGACLSPYDGPTSFAVGAPHSAFLQMIHVPDGFGRMI